MVVGLLAALLSLPAGLYSLWNPLYAVIYQLCVGGALTASIVLGAIASRRAALLACIVLVLAAAPFAVVTVTH